MSARTRSVTLVGIGFTFFFLAFVAAHDTYKEWIADLFPSSWEIGCQDWCLAASWNRFDDEMAIIDSGTGDAPMEVMVEESDFAFGFSGILRRMP